MVLDTFGQEPLSTDELFEQLRAISIAEVKSVIYKVEDILASEKMLVRLQPADVMIVGDMHGDIGVTLAIANQLITTNTTTRVVFLGDYVDRGPHQVDVINLVLLLKATFPERITLLRGNHEISSLNEESGFFNCLNMQFGKPDGQILWYLYNRLFKQMPLAAITWNGILLLHGGIPEGMQALGDIDMLPREFTPANQRVVELLWNDPVEGRKGLRYRKSVRGGEAKEFGELAFKEFMEKTGITMLIRAHEEFNDGFRYFFNEQLLSIYSSRRVLTALFERQIKPKIVRIAVDGKMSIDTIEPAPIKT